MFVNGMKVNDDVDHRLDETHIVHTFGGGFSATPPRIPSLIGASVEFVVVAHTVGIDDDGPLFVSDVVKRREVSLFQRG